MGKTATTGYRHHSGVYPSEWTTQEDPECSHTPPGFQKVDIVQFEAALGDWAQANLGEEEAIAIDGKGLLGIHGEELPGGEAAGGLYSREWAGTAQKGEIVT
jgi:hypothetical protein